MTGRAAEPARLRLGTRLALALGVLALVVFAVVGVVTVGIMRDYFARRLDEQLTKSQLDQVDRIRERRVPLQPTYSWYSAIFAVDRGTAVPQAGGALPADTAPLAGIASEAVGTEVLRTVAVGDAGQYRVRACPIESGQVLVSAAPEADLDRTVHQLVAVEVVVFLLALAALVLTGKLVLRRGLRPLGAMADTAHRITTHDLTDSANLPVRVAGSGGGAEVEELRNALNRMLEHIDSSLAARTEANEKLRRFVADASHELRTPLTSIRGYADLFRYAAASEPAERDAHLGKIREETARMSLLVDDLVLLARLDTTEAGTPLRPEPIDLAELLSAAAQAFRAAHPDRELELSLPGPARVLADPVRLRQILDNLLANAAAHTPPGSRVRLAGALQPAAPGDTGPGTGELGAGESNTVDSDTVEPDTVEPDTVEPDTVEPDTVEPDTVEPDTVDAAGPGSAPADQNTVEGAQRTIVLTVADSGPGIPPEQSARVFDRFYRVDDHRARSAGGSGLGLAVVHSLVTAHGGTVRVTGWPDGAVFTVRIPVR